VSRVPLPKDLRERVWRRLYEDADRLDWENLSSQDKTAQYVRWLDVEDIGGILTLFMERDAARVYIKDTPMKEYARALAGLGPGAAFTDNRQGLPETMVRSALGAAWEVEPDSVAVKPLHCWARKGGERRYVCWARADGLGALVWAALNVLADDPDADPLLLIRETAANPTSREVRTRQRKIAERCGLPLEYVRPPAR
jgi:hypothetical protein